MTHSRSFALLSVIALAACASAEPLTEDSFNDVEQARAQGAEAAADAAEAEADDATTDTDTTVTGAFSQEELDTLNALGMGLGDSLDAVAFGLGSVEVTDQDTGATFIMEGMAIQYQSDDRFWDNTLVFAWSGLDVTAGTADALLRFRAAGLANPGSVPLDPVSNSMLPSWILFGDAAADARYFNEDGDLTLSAVTLDPATEIDCSSGSTVATCSMGDLEGDFDMVATGHAGFSGSYDGPADRGPSIGTRELTATFDLPLHRISIER